MYLIWLIFFYSMIASVCFNVMSRNVEGLGISPFIMFSLTALALPPSGFFQAYIQNRFGRKGSLISASLLTGLFTAASGIVLSLWQDSSVVLIVTLTLISRFGASCCLGSTLLFSTELVPTCVRSRGLSMAHAAGAAASLLSPYILHLGTYYRAAPSVILCLMFFICAYVCLLLPETTNRKLPITLAEGEEFGKQNSMFDFLKTTKTKTNVEAELDADTCQKLMS